MLFQSSVPQLFSKIHFKLYSAENTARKKAHAKLLEMYHGQQLQHLETDLNRFFAEPDRLQKVCLNLIRKVIDNLCQTYRIPPTRELEGTKKDRELYKQIVDSCAMDLKMKMASRYARLLRSILIKVTWRDGVDLDILCGDLVDVEVGDSPTDLRKILITDWGSGTRPEDVEYSLWSAESWKRLDYRGDVIDSAKNPYGVLPFIGIHDSPPLGNDFFVPLDDCLQSIQEMVNLKLSDLSHILMHQGHGIGFIKGQNQSDEGVDLFAGPGSLIELPGDGDLGFVSQEAPIREFYESIDKIIKWCAVSYGLSAQALSTDVTQESGISKHWDSAELGEMRVEQKIVWQAYEQKLFDLMCLVHNTHNSKERISDSAKLKINFADPSRPAQSPLDMAEAQSFYQAMGVKSSVDILMEIDKDLRSREEAVERLKQIREENKQFATQGVKIGEEK